MFFDKLFKKNKNQVPEDAPNIDKKLFRISRPYGYNPADVEKAIEKYHDVINEQKDTIIKLKDSLMFQKERNEKLEDQLKNVQMQLNFSNVPSTNEIQEEYIQQKFEEQFKNNKDQKEKDSVHIELQEVSHEKSGTTSKNKKIEEMNKLRAKRNQGSVNNVDNKQDTLSNDAPEENIDEEVFNLEDLV